MAALQDDFAAYTTIGDRVEAVQDERRPVHARTAGPSFALPPLLEPFVLLSKSARGAAAAGLVEKATAAPGTYVFSELLEQPSIRGLAKYEQHARSYRLLELFAYGTWADYDGARDQFPPLSVEHETKLKHLTVLSLATEMRVIPYSTLLSTLSLDSVPELEDLLIELFYANVLTGRLDQKHSRLEVVTSRGRDVRPAETSTPAPGAAPAAADGPPSASDAMQVDLRSGTATPRTTDPSAPTPRAPSLASLHATLSSWQSTLLNLIRSLEDHLGAVHAEATNSAQMRYEHEERVRALAKEVGGGAGAAGGAKGKGKSAEAKAPTQRGSVDAGEDGQMDLDAVDALGSEALVGGGTARGAADLGEEGLPQNSEGGGGGSGGGGSMGRTRKRGRI